ncbi:MAG: VOC family protein [Ferruginibacter sp.]
MSENITNVNLVMMVPTLSVKNGIAAIEFYKKAFGAIELMSNISDDGKAVAELHISGARFVVADEAPEYDNFSPETLGGTAVRMGLQVNNPDEVAQQAVLAGAREIYPVADQDYGYRLGRIIDPFGHHWEIFKPLNH